MRVSLKSVDFKYGRRPALVGISWSLGPGVTGLLGPNGAGKTTLLNLLVGLTKPTAGEISMEAEAGKPPRAGFVPQRFSLASEMTCGDTVAYAAWVNGLAKSDCVDAAAEALQAVALGDMATRRVRALSGGQRQRLAIAAALSHRPDFLVLDEPTAGLDPGQRLRVRETIARVGEKNTVLLSTHLIEDIVHLCDQVGVLVDGRLAFDGTTAELGDLVRGNAVNGTEEPTYGSAFEQAYDRLVSSLRAADD